MNLKKFEYLHKDIPFLKRDISFRMLFLFLFLGIFIWQIVSLFMQYFTSTVSTAMIIASISVMLLSLLFIALSLMYTFKTFRILDVIKKQGRCISSVEILFSTKKTGFMKLYALITEILALITSIVLICSVTYTILQLAFLSSISFYLPVLALVCVCGYNSVYHINAEIKTVQTVQEFNSVY